MLRLRIRNADILKREVEEQAHKLPDEAKRLAERLLAQIETISAEVEGLDHSIKMHAKTSEETRLMQTMPGVGPMSAIAISAFCPPAKNFRTGGILQHGLVLYLDSIRQVVRNGWGASQKWARKM